MTPNSLEERQHETGDKDTRLCPAALVMSHSLGWKLREESFSTAGAREPHGTQSG